MQSKGISECLVTGSYFWDRLMNLSWNVLCRVCRVGTVLGFGAVEAICMCVCSVSHRAVCSMLLFFLWLILRRHQYLRLYLCRVILCGTVIDENTKRFEKKRGGGASCIPGAVLSFAWRDRGRSRKSAIGMDGTTAILAFFPSKCIEQGWPATWASEPHFTRPFRETGGSNTERIQLALSVSDTGNYCLLGNPVIH